MTNTIDIISIRQNVINGLSQMQEAKKLFQKPREMLMFSEELCPSLVTPNSQTYKSVLTDNDYCILIIVDNVDNPNSPLMVQIYKN